MGLAKLALVILCTSLNVFCTKTEQKHFDHNAFPADSSKLANIELSNITACDCGWMNSQASNIVGGSETGVNQYPAMAALISLTTNSLYCGAHIISDRYLLTAGHCVFQRPASSLAVLVGEHNIATGGDTPYSAIYNVNAYEINPSYNNSNYDNDIAILRTSTRIVFSRFVGPVCLPFKYTASSFVNQPVTILGWGQIEFSGPTSDVLLQAILGVLSNNQCASALGQTISSTEICTYAFGRDSCQSDSGGPVIWTDNSIARMYLVGIISHGIGCASNFPGVNTRVSSFLNWILSRTSDASYCNR